MRGDLAAHADAIVTAGRAAWPRVRLDVAAVLAHLTPLPVAPAPAYAADVYLACGCARGDAAEIGRAHV